MVKFVFVPPIKFERLTNSNECNDTKCHTKILKFNFVPSTLGLAM